MSRWLKQSGTFVRLDEEAAPASLFAVTPSVSSRVSATSVVTVAPSGSTNTKGSFVTLIASTTEDYSVLALDVIGLSTSGANNSGLLDIAVGAAGAETVLAANINCGNNTSVLSVESSLKTIFLPVAIPAGSRISARLQRANGSASASVRIEGFSTVPGAAASPSSLDTYGADTSKSTGVAFSAVNTWTQVTPSTSRDYVGFIATVGSDSTDVTSEIFGVDIGVGDSGSEVAHYSPHLWGRYSTEVMWSHRVGLLGAFYPVEVPAGSRIAARMTTASAVGGVHVVLHGIPK